MSLMNFFSRVSLDMDYSNVTTLLDFNWYDIDAFQKKNAGKLVSGKLASIDFSHPRLPTGNFGRYRGAGSPERQFVIGLAE